MAMATGMGRPSGLLTRRQAGGVESDGTASSFTHCSMHSDTVDQMNLSRLRWREASSWVTKIDAT